MSFHPGQSAGEHSPVDHGSLHSWCAARSKAPTVWSDGRLRNEKEEAGGFLSVNSAPTAKQTVRTGAAARPLPVTMVLVAAPSRHIVQSLTAGLHDLGVGRVLQVGSAARLDEVIAGTVVGDLALVSVAFGAPTDRLIHGLCRVGWPRVIALVPTADPGTFIAALHAGASGVLLPNTAWPAPDPPADPPGARDLSPREQDVIRLVAEGQSNRGIGQELLLSSLTVKSHLARIGRKLGTGDRAQIVAIAMRAGIID